MAKYKKSCDQSNGEKDVTLMLYAYIAIMYAYKNIRVCYRANDMNGHSYNVVICLTTIEIVFTLSQWIAVVHILTFEISLHSSITILKRRIIATWHRLIVILLLNKCYFKMVCLCVYHQLHNNIITKYWIKLSSLKQETAAHALSFCLLVGVLIGDETCRKDLSLD